ncbi:MAG: hypothetical protein ABJJ14_13820, partial [Cyclobacteriaceae bacterium]
YEICRKPFRVIVIMDFKPRSLEPCNHPNAKTANYFTKRYSSHEFSLATQINAQNTFTTQYNKYRHKAKNRAVHKRYLW